VLLVPAPIVKVCGIAPGLPINNCDPQPPSNAAARLIVIAD
jgi:hypothetical protein